MTEASSSLDIRLTATDDISMLLGSHDKHIKLIEETTETTIHTRGEVIQIIGEETDISLVSFRNPNVTRIDQTRDPYQYA